MEEKEFSYINMVPFIDVMLVLLTIVLMTSTFVVSGIIPVELPKVAGKYETMIRTGVIEIDQSGSLYYQGKPVDLAGLTRELGNMPKETPFLIRADRSLPLQNFIEVLDTVKTMGFKKVSLQTEEQRR
ncbi:MAG: biopolymer transporter ExbD [Syntrophus sp. (in: bacteria)]|nr:biopolymer transporter ExbD [Syntrophus sp. (in: bacteria)]